MQLKKLALAATATSLFAVAAAATAAGSLAPIPVNITGQQNKQVVIPFFSNQQIRAYGFGIDT